MTIEQLKAHVAMMRRTQPEYANEAAKWFAATLFWVDWTQEKK